MSKNLTSQTIARTIEFFNSEDAADSVLGKITADLHYTAARNDDDTLTFRTFEQRNGCAGLSMTQEVIVSLDECHGQDFFDNVREGGHLPDDKDFDELS